MIDLCYGQKFTVHGWQFGWCKGGLALPEKIVKRLTILILEGRRGNRSFPFDYLKNYENFPSIT